MGRSAPGKAFLCLSARSSCVPFPWSCPRALLSPSSCAQLLGHSTLQHVHQQPWPWDLPSPFPLPTPGLVHFWVVAEPSTALFPALTQFSIQEKNALVSSIPLCNGLQPQRVISHLLWLPLPAWLSQLPAALPAPQGA